MSDFWKILDQNLPEIWYSQSQKKIVDNCCFGRSKRFDINGAHLEKAEINKSWLSKQKHAKAEGTPQVGIKKTQKTKLSLAR